MENNKPILFIAGGIVLFFIVVVVVGIIYFFVKNKDNDNSSDKFEITKIVYVYGDSSVPPQYHRSYTITITENEIHVVVDSYGDVLEDKKFDITKEDFDSIVSALDKYSIKNRTKNKDSKGCTGGDSDTIRYYSGESKKFEGYNYNCAGEKFGNLDGDVEGFAEEIKKIIPDFSSLID